MATEVTPLKKKDTPDIKKKINPDIKNVDIGIRELRTLTIYPLSAKDQIELSNKLISVLSETGSTLNETVTNEAALAFFQKIITENLEIILEYVVEKKQLPKMDELTNNQLYTIANIIFEVNYEGCLKNFVHLYQRAKNIIS